MSFPQGHLRPLFPWQQGHYANLLLQQQNNVSTGREPSSRSTNQTREVTADVQVPRFTDFSIPEQRAMINNNMVMPADSIALVESARNLYQSGNLFRKGIYFCVFNYSIVKDMDNRHTLSANMNFICTSFRNRKKRQSSGKLFFLFRGE